MTLIYLAIAWLLGIVGADLVPLPLALFQLTAALGVVVVILRWRVPRVRLAALILCCTAFGGWRYQAVQISTTPRSVRVLAGHGTVTVEGSVQGDPKRTEEGQQVVLETQTALVGAQTRRVEGLVLLNLPPYPQYHYGQRLLAMGELQEPRTATRPGEFDYRAYLKRKGIFVLMREPLVRVLPGQTGNPALQMLLAFRDRCKAVLLRELPEPQASIGVGVLLGLQSSIPDDTYNTFSVTGTSHILVVSGWNMTVN